MNRLLLLVSSLLSLVASADCMAAWLSAEPAKDMTLTQRPVVLVTLGGMNSQTPASRIAFVSASERVDVEVVKTFEAYQQRVVLVRPTAALAPGAWELSVSPLKGGEAKRFGPWRVTTTTDTRAPELEQTPKAGETKWTAYGCGPGSSVKVTGTKTTEPAFFEAVATVGDRSSRTGLLVQKPEADLELGHGMCAGAFHFEPGAKVSVTLTPIDFAGNRGATSAAMTFVAPSP